MMFAKSACSCASFSTRASEICRKGEGKDSCFWAKSSVFPVGKKKPNLYNLEVAFYFVLLNVRRGFCKPRDVTK